MDAVLLVSLGGPNGPDEIRPFIDSVLGGRPVPPERIDEVVQHYEAVGGRSPLTAHTQAQAEALSAQLKRDGHALPVFVGMRCWAPWLRDAVAEMASAGLRRVAVIVLSPLRDRHSWNEYERSLSQARQECGASEMEFVHVTRWHDHPSYVDAIAEGIARTVERRSEVDPNTSPIVFSFHSLPSRMAGIDAYVSDAETMSRLIVEKLGWWYWTIAYQSRTGRPEEPWLEPDVTLRLAELADAGHQSVVVACPGFVCDHVEVLYDLDIEASGEAARRGMAFLRAPTVGTHPSFISMLSSLVGDLCRPEAEESR